MNMSIVEKLSEILLNEDKKYPMYQRYRALFSLKGLGTPEAVDLIIQALGKENESELFKHELAYCLGQLQDERAISTLKGLVSDSSEFVMVRHEAAESLGAISNLECIEFLKQHLADPCKELAHTCEIAILKIKHDHSVNGGSSEIHSEKANNDKSKYGPIDPAPAETKVTDVSELKQILCDQSLDLWTRYKAMFALRDINTPEAVEALGTALLNDTSSALFRHEIGFVFGEMGRTESVPYLQHALNKLDEAPMVRHEAAEALGAVIGEEKALETLKEYAADKCQVVRESCEVAIDMYNYENSKEFQYAII
ncbi:Deoxyhypusine hydroxylase [Zancudomyces culisetae]|uniref:Deoxyhypusine hydroxylase n=1 Tax=Zancudomyces culisetae TaxID=1213189 RepID=A0A1R1PPC9_ZANCU|nr:Deoxyhypusine hydroxylase [Zancudomyces culisetae]|eukprot:OMH82753.1 Deoxyhypusine hydroxylase [Zancudomyces culisetae]